MGEDINAEQFDGLIEQARAEFREMRVKNRALFGGDANLARIDNTIGQEAPKGDIGVPKQGMPDNFSLKDAAGLMSAIDLTELKLTATDDDIRKIAQRAHDESAKTVCVYPERVALVQEVTGGNPPPIAVVGFPFVSTPGKQDTEATLAKTRLAIAAGAKEIDMVVATNFKGDDTKTPADYQAHYDYIRAVVEEANKTKTPVKVILETAYLTDKQKVEASMLAKMAGAEFVKTSTGFAKDELMLEGIPKDQKGATPHDVALMRRTVGNTTLTDDGQVIPMGVKASGGVRNCDQAIAVYEAGASRIGASGGINVLNLKEKLEAERKATAEQSGGGPGVAGGDTGPRFRPGAGDTTY